jgi:hypothetical protein
MGPEDNPKAEELDMPVLAEIVAAPALAALAAVFASHQEAQKPVDPCRPPLIRLESANIAALPGPNSPACREAMKARESEKKKEKP